jgi:hypothetical protein
MVGFPVRSGCARVMGIAVEGAPVMATLDNVSADRRTLDLVVRRPNVVALSATARFKGGNVITRPANVCAIRDIWVHSVRSVSVCPNVLRLRDPVTLQLGSVYAKKVSLVKHVKRSNAALLQRALKRSIHFSVVQIVEAKREGNVIL